MLKFLSFNENESGANYFKHLTEAMFECETVNFTNLSELQKSLEDKKHFDLVFFNLSHDIDDGFIQNLKLGQDIDSIFILNSECEFKEQLKGKFPKSSIIEKFDNPKKLLEHVSLRLNLNPTSAQSELDFVPLRIEFLEKIKTLKADIYLKVSNIKYLLLFKKGIEITNEDWRKYKEKQVTHFYVKGSDSKELLHSIDLNAISNDQVTSIENGIQYLDLFHTTVQTIEIEPHSAAFAKAAMKSFFENLHTDKSLDELIKLFIKHRNYISEHSFLVSLISNSILNYTSFPSEMNGMKLCFASILHDITLPNVDLAKKESREEAKESDILKLHPLHATEFAMKFKSAPADIDKILSQHHEKYDGSGYPRGLRFKQIAPLSAVFIVAHEIVDVLYADSFSPECVHNYLKDKKEIYKEGVFKEIIAAAFKSFQINLD